MTLRRFATVTADVLRATLTNGKRGAATTHLSMLQATPLQPANPELLLRMELRTPHQVFETYVVGHHDIVTGDMLSIAGVTYPIRGVAKWEPPGRAIGEFMHLVVEDVQL
ncbi:MAG: hypothetical protein RJA29_2742 [Pseudomonadota bacterium]|jgi:hypothetical protein